MGKRSEFKRVERDYYPTPFKAVLPLLPFLHSGASFWEPCAGDGRLIGHLNGHAACRFSSDIEPQGKGIVSIDALNMEDGRGTALRDAFGFDCIITNPPWNRKILHPMIETFAAIAPTWLLFDADWSHTQQASEYLHLCSHIVAIGRVRWIEDSNSVGKDNACWYRFSADNKEDTKFFGKPKK